MTPEYQAAGKCFAECDEARREAMKWWRDGVGYFQVGFACRGANGKKVRL